MKTAAEITTATVGIHEVAQLTGVDEDTVRSWLRRGTFLPPLGFSTKLLWHREALESWLRRQQERQETDHAAATK
jgi:hypothetical protein